jgi:hypothetical protein
MERNIGEVVSGEQLVRDVFTAKGVLLLAAGTILNQNLKSLLLKHRVTTVMVKGGLLHEIA